MTDYLLVTWDGGGNVPPALSLGRALKTRGHGVRVLAHPTLRSSVEAAGLEMREYETVRPFSAVENHSLPRLVATFSDPRLADDVLAEARRAPTDVVVVDCMLLPALRACARAGLPHVSLEHLFDGYLRGGWAKGPVGLAARLRRVPPEKQWSAASTALVATLPSLDPTYDAGDPGNRVWTGPFVASTMPKDWSEQEPHVLVSLSTFAYAGMAQAMQRLLDAVGGLGVRATVTTGPVLDPADLRAPGNAEVHRFVPHDDLMPAASLLVGHGGHATTMRALAHDLPVLVVPMHPMLDQPMVGRQVQAAGAGRLLRKKASVEQLRAAIGELVADGPHRAAAARLGAEIRSSGGVDRAVELLEQLDGQPAAQRQP
jgi:UDP:flavonoid glycosyltransferase YjiC (YdhE family)